MIEKIKNNKLAIQILKFVIVGGIATIIDFAFLWFFKEIVNLPVLVSTILEEISSSLNDYPISNLNYTEYCNNNEYNGYLFTFPGSVEGCTCADVRKYLYEQNGEKEVKLC